MDSNHHLPIISRLSLPLDEMTVENGIIKNYVGGHRNTNAECFLM